ncbi:MAG: hypothetical protein WA004_07075 [Saprospiraceae bacterium]
MSTAYSFLNGLHSIITLLVGLGLAGSFLGMGKARGMKFREAVVATLLFVFLAGTWYCVRLLDQAGREGWAFAVLAVFWSLAVFGVLYATFKAKWN